jgi:hypothetical protein
MQSFPSLNGKKGIDHMANYVNKVASDMELAKPLKDLVEAMHITHPVFEFVAHDRDFYVRHDVKYIGLLKVFDSGVYLGKIRLVHEDYRGKGYKDVFMIFSENIKRSRGPSGQTATIDINKAIKIILDSFKPPAMDQLAGGLYAALSSEISDMTRHYKWALQDIMDRSRLRMAEFILDLHDNGAKELPEDLKVELFKKSTAMQTFRDSKIGNNIATNFESKNGSVAALFEDGSVWYVDIADKTLHKLSSTYDLPTNFQEKISMLRILEHRQPVENMGVYFDVTVQTRKCKLFFLVAGDTVFTC